MTDPTRGVLYPAQLPSFHRLPAPVGVQHLVRWFWIPEWDVAPGRVSRQDLVSYPASNLVVERDLVGLAGPTTRASHRDLTGHGWAVGALLRPAAVPAFTADPASLRDDYLRLDLRDLHDAVTTAMTGDSGGEQRRAQATDAFALWLVGQVPDVGAEALLANRLADVIDRDSEVRRIEDVAERLNISERSVQRLARKYVGVPPSAMIRRRRLQEAAERVRSDPELDLSAVAADLGYADHAHLANDFRAVLGFTPSSYRLDSTGRAGALDDH